VELFEAGALAQHGERPRLFTYLYGVDELSGPLGQFQATHFHREDSRRLVLELANAGGSGKDADVITKFEKTWDSFEAEVLTQLILPIQRLVPQFPELFANKKTFHESFPDCSDHRWDDRLRRTVRTHEQLSRPDVAEIVSSDPYLRGGYSELMAALDRYDMHIAASLMQLRDYKKLSESEQRQVEDARKRILDLVFTLQRTCRPPVFREALSFESEPATEKRKAQIHALELRLGRGELPNEKLMAARDSLDWALDRIVYYAACGMGLFPEVPFAELIAALKMEEERARTRNLVRNLQPLYYAAECIDVRMILPVNAALASRLLEIVDRVEDFVQAHGDRDSGEHIRRRIQSIRSKL
jgi:hypothetical protein